MAPRLALTLCLLLPAAARAEPTPAERALRLGEQAMDADRFEEAIGHFELALRLDPALAKARLNLAAAHLARGEDREALPHLAAYLRARPEHFIVRPHYADALLRLGLTTEASLQLERFVAEAQPFAHLADGQLIGMHTKLMELAARRRDAYGEHLHRGIGLYLLAGKRTDLGDERSLRLAEGLLCKAAAELTLARLAEPGKVRPCWYLHRVWVRLAQSQPAMRWLRAAAAQAGPLSDLTPAEARDLTQAARMAELGPRKR